ncbi:MAG: alpha amylase C-terminal domain-containing protein [Armatimonadetes bacterium]|nr:alpha amylase C-terminal domain-containing protein [Armatimonadota bacterium]
MPRKKVLFMYDPDGRECMSNLNLYGSWDAKGRFRRNWSLDLPTPMTRDRRGRWKARVELVGDGPHRWEWMVLADGPAGQQLPAVFGEEPLHFTLEGAHPVVVYAPTCLTLMGAVRDEQDLVFRFWAPHAEAVEVKIWKGGTGPAEYFPMEEMEVGLWTRRFAGEWDQRKGLVYAYKILTSEGAVVYRPDPYARRLQGQQFGVGELYLHPLTGRQVHRYYEEPARQARGLGSWVRFLRFELQGYAHATRVALRLLDEKSRPLGRGALRRRLGTTGRALVRQNYDEFWLDRLRLDGSIDMFAHGAAWSVIVNSPELLTGLHYEFEADHDGTISVLRDPYSSRLDGDQSWQRFSVIESGDFPWRHDDVPRLARTPEEMIAYELHVGSIFGRYGNLERSNFKHAIERLDYLVELGVNTLQLMPTNTFEGLRDWGYMGTYSFAMSEEYGFWEEGRWVSGHEAVKRFVDAAHGRGLRVLTDVVYNHLGGDHNPLWELDGKKNPWFEWDPNPEVLPSQRSPEDMEPIPRNTASARSRTSNPTVRHTPWGPIPAYNKPFVGQFFIDHALTQLEECHFDGIRFDFTNLVHAQEGGGGTEGWNLLRTVNRTIRFFHPDALTVAEEFPVHPILTTPPDRFGGGGAGFNAMWNTEFQHRLIHDPGEPGILQQAAVGWPVNVDQFLHHLVSHPGFARPMDGFTVISNHDEVGNGARTIRVACGFRDEPPDAWARGAARMVFGLGMLSPGIPMFFQGEESLAENAFSWGVYGTWDVGWEWLEKDDGPRLLFRRLHHGFCRAAIELRRSSPALQGGGRVARVYTHNNDGVLAFSRGDGEEVYGVLASFHREALRDYPVHFLPGSWRLVLNSDDRVFGGEGGPVLPVVGGGPRARFHLPPATLLVYRKSPAAAHRSDHGEEQPPAHG